MGDELLGTGMNGHQHYMDATGYSYPNPQPFTGYYEHPPFQYINVGPTIHQTHQESEYWSMQMNSYKYGISGQYATSSYYGVYGNVDHGPRANWDYAEVANVGGSAAAVDLPAEQGVVSEMQYVPEEGSIDEEDDAVNTQVLLEDDVDPDTMSYEELLDLGEAVGAQSRGLSQELIDRLPTSKHKSGGIFSRKKSEERCVICQMRYKRGDRQINLPCKHAYHTECGSKWLSINKTCPVCNTEVFADE